MSRKSVKRALDNIEGLRAIFGDEMVDFLAPIWREALARPGRFNLERTAKERILAEHARIKAESSAPAAGKRRPRNSKNTNAK